MSEFFETAQRIGARLCRDAIWSGDRCNWIGASIENLGTWEVIRRSFGPDLYGGTSGIGLLLAELAALNGERIFRRVAEAAAANAIAQMEQIPPTLKLGFYSGHSGIAYALVRMGQRLANESLLQRGLGLFEELSDICVEEQAIDVISGLAGAIPVLLLVHERFNRPAMIDLAARCAHRLVSLAERTSAGWSWDAAGIPDQPNLTGFSHGTAGIGWALLEFAHASGNSHFQTAAEEAFRYERSNFNAEEANWPDFRKPEIPANPAVPYPCANAWCHGAAGIGLSRLRAYQLTGNKVFREEAEIAASTMLKDICESKDRPVSFSLCHGQGGNADILLSLSQTFNNPNYRSTAEQAARRGIELFEANANPWRCGVRGGSETPSLLLGLAGISLLYLRLEPGTVIDSVLLVGPSAQKWTL